MRRRRGRRWCRAVELALAALAGAAPAAADVPDAPLAANAHLTIVGPPQHWSAPVALAGAGDVNGDGIGDVVVGNGRQSAAGRHRAGVAWVVFGARDARTVDVRDLRPSDGFRIEGAPDPDVSGRQWGRHLCEEELEARVGGEAAGTAVAPAGDANGDGLADLALGAPGVSDRAICAGAVYVVFGKRSSEPVDLGSLGSAGYRIDSARRGDRLGAQLAGLGDADGDRRGDVAVHGRRSGVRVVFGAPDTERIDVDATGERGFAVVDAEANVPSEVEEMLIAAPGDFNGDGRADLAVASPYAVPDGVTVSVVFGRGGSEPVDLARLGEQGAGFSSPWLTPVALAGAGDVDGDGLADLAVTSGHGRIGVLRGRRTGGRLDTAGQWALAVRTARDDFDPSFAGLGDTDRDGRSEFAVGRPEFDLGCSSNLGAAYVLKAASGPTTVRLTDFGADAGYRLSGPAPGAAAGAQVAAGGDLSGDGGSDLLVGAPHDAGPLTDRELRQALEGGGGPLRRNRAPHVTYAVARTPPELVRGPELPATSCLRARVVDRALDRVLARRRLRLRVTLREVDPRGDVVIAQLYSGRAGAFAAHGGPVQLAHGEVRFAGPGTRTLDVRLGRLARRALARRRRARIVVTALRNPDQYRVLKARFR